MAAGRAELAAQLRRWMAGELGAPALQAFAEAARRAQRGPAALPQAPGAERPVDDPAAEALAEALADLDLLAVHLLCPEDAPALLALCEAADPPAALERWRRHRQAIDLDARSRRLRGDPFYRPFCR